jgi:hypothetical protein
MTVRLQLKNKSLLVSPRELAAKKNSLAVNRQSYNDFDVREPTEFSLCELLLLESGS